MSLRTKPSRLKPGETRTVLRWNWRWQTWFWSDEIWAKGEWALGIDLLRADTAITP